MERINEHTKTPLADTTFRLQAFRNNDYAFEIEENPDIHLLTGLDRISTRYVLYYVIVCLKEVTCYDYA